jgi:hypothetical protein
MNNQISKFVGTYQENKNKNLSISDLKTSRGNISFRKLLIANNHELWQKCKCGNEEDLRVTWKCSECGAILFKPK